MKKHNMTLGITINSSNFNSIKKLSEFKDFNNSYFNVIVSEIQEPPEVETIIDTNEIELNTIKSICKLFYKSGSTSLKYHEIIMGIFKDTNTIEVDNLEYIIDLMHDNDYLHFDEKKYIAYINTKVFDFYGFS